MEDCNEKANISKKKQCLYDKQASGQKIFLVLLYSAKSNSDHFTISNFTSFFQKINFFNVSIPYTAQVRKVKSAKNHFLLLFYSAKSNSDHFTFSNLSSSFKKLIFLLFRPPILHR